MGDEPMKGADVRASLSRPDVRDMTVDQVNGLLDHLTPIPTTPAEQAELLAMLPLPGDPDAPMNVVRSLRLPEELNRRVDSAAEAEGVPASVFIRRAIESVLAGRVKANLVNVDDVIRAIRSVPPAAA
jgi:predicted DNA-binding protein